MARLPFIALLALAATTMASPIAADAAGAGAGAAALVEERAESNTTSSAACPAIDETLAGSQSVGLGTGVQFITGQCFTAADCASACCVAQSSGISLCKAETVTEEAGLSCASTCTVGGGSNTTESTASTASTDTTMDSTNTTSPDESSTNTTSPDVSSTTTTTTDTNSTSCAIDESLPGSQSVGLGTGVQFITGQCFTAADCASACCVAQDSGVALCKAELPTVEAGGSCDFTCSS